MYLSHMSLPWRPLISLCLRQFPWKRQAKHLATTTLQANIFGKQYREIQCLKQFRYHVGVSHNFIRCKSRARGGLDAVESEQLEKYADDLLDALSGRQDHMDKSLKRWRNDLSGILFQLSKRNEETKLLHLFKRISSAKHANEASYTIMMRHYADQNNFRKVKYYFDDMEKESVLFHGRSFVPLINVCLRLKDYEQANEYFQQLLQMSRKTYIYTAFTDVIKSCAELVDLDNVKHLTRMVESAFSTMEEYGSEPLDSDAIEATKRWFHRDPEDRWSINDVEIDKIGECPCCCADLQRIFISEERFIRLKRNMMAFVESTIALKRNSRIADVDRKRRNNNIRNRIQRQSEHYEFYDTLITGVKESTREIASTKRSYLSNPEIFSVLGNLEKFLDDNGPFDVVIDALNIGYYTKGFNPLQVRDVVETFKHKRCLVLCAGILKEKLLTQHPVPAANVRLQQLLLYLKKTCDIFFVGSSVLDDYYILYTLLYHDFNIQLVSRDLFRDHLFHLDSENKVDFQRWQMANQYILESFTPDNKPIFLEQSNFKVSVQRNKNGWHVPKSRDQWLCIREANR